MHVWTTQIYTFYLTLSEKKREKFFFLIKRKTLFKYFRDLSCLSDHVNHENICLLTIIFLLRMQVMKKTNEIYCCKNVLMISFIIYFLTVWCFIRDLHNKKSDRTLFLQNEHYPFLECYLITVSPNPNLCRAPLYLLLRLLYMHAQQLNCVQLSGIYGLLPSRLLCPSDFPARILEWVTISFSRLFLTQGLNLYLLHWQADSLPLSHWGSPTEVPTDTQTSSKNIKNWSNMLL